jgi:predicted ribosome quality control (RQC) complex YloA/Tae2 family protein
MAFDACMMRAVLSEISDGLIGAKIEKITQPTNDEVNLVLHLGKKSARLVFNVGPNSPRLQLSNIARESPLSAPMFCMYLRKYIGGAKIQKVEQLGFDRIAVFTLSAYDEMGFMTTRKLICEIMGKYANLILSDGDFKIMNALKLIDFSDSTVRQVLPGLMYKAPENLKKLSPLVIDKSELLEKIKNQNENISVEKFITSAFSGVAIQIARELCYRATGKLATPVFEADTDRLCAVILEWQELLISHGYSFTLTKDAENTPLDYSYMQMTHLASLGTVTRFDNHTELFDEYFSEKDRLEKIRHRARDVMTLLSNLISRTEKKLGVQKKDLLDSEKGEEYKRIGDLITSNIYLLRRGMASFSAVDYYREDCPTVEIELDEKLSPSQNAQRYYKLYNKSKKAKEVLTQQIARWENELLYFKSVELFLRQAESEEDIMQIRDELSRAGYGKGIKNPRTQKAPKLRLTEYKTSDGMRVLCGRNNIQNDYLTLKLADKDDIWFHVKGFHGSHVILFTEGREPSDRDYTEACEIAAYHSEAKGTSVPVDYTRVKNIKKPQGSKPGFVTYKTNYTAYVTPKIPKGE